MNNKNNILESENTLQIIREIENNPQTTQRSLAQKLQMSLGKINFLLNALIDKGIIEAKNFKNSKNKLSYMYLLTSEGIKIKFQLAQKFLAWKINQYEKLKKEIDRLQQESSSVSYGQDGRSSVDTTTDQQLTQKV